MIDPNKIYERLTLEGGEWVDKHQAAELLEGTLKTVHSQCVLSYRSQGLPVGECEHRATTDPSFIKARENAIQARTEANRAKVRYRAAEAWVDSMRTAEASHRAAARVAP